MNSVARVLSVQVGRIASYPPVERSSEPWQSAIVKSAVTGRIHARALGLDGDAQADLRNHGGEWRAINVYPSEHYDFWHALTGLEGMAGGAFGENFTTQGLVETTACIGDVFRVGEAVVAISQPRGPCYKLNRRWNRPDIQQIAEQTHRFGWYLRVQQEGQVGAGDDLTLLERPFPQWTVARVWDLAQDPADKDAVRALADCPALSEGWKRSLRKKLDHTP